MSTLLDFLPEIDEQIKQQLLSDNLRWGETWKYRPREGQELRTYSRIKDYFDQYINASIPIPWLKIIGECIVCLVREQHPEESKI